MISQPHLIARVRPEFARGERDRCCHFFPLPADGAIPAVLSAYCGFESTPVRPNRWTPPSGCPAPAA